MKDLPAECPQSNNTLPKDSDVLAKIEQIIVDLARIKEDRERPVALVNVIPIEECIPKNVDVGYWVNRTKGFETRGRLLDYLFAKEFIKSLHDEGMTRTSAMLYQLCARVDSLEQDIKTMSRQTRMIDSHRDNSLCDHPYTPTKIQMTLLEKGIPLSSDELPVGDILNRCLRGISQLHEIELHQLAISYSKRPGEDGCEMPSITVLYVGDEKSKEIDRYQTSAPTIELAVFGVLKILLNHAESIRSSSAQALESICK